MSKGNSAFNSSHCEVYQDMTRPLAHYWIASSHNTYVTLFSNLFHLPIAGGPVTLKTNFGKILDPWLLWL